MQNSHHWVEHLWRHISIYEIVLKEVHMSRCTPCIWWHKYLIYKLFYFLLVWLSVLEINILSFLLLIQTFSFVLSWSLNQIRWINWATQSFFNNTLNILDLNISIESHVRHHYSNVFRSYITILIKIVPKLKYDISIFTYISNVNFILDSRFPIKIVVKFFKNEGSVTKSAFFFCSNVRFLLFFCL
jgi:hypothetical protein